MKILAELFIFLEPFKHCIMLQAGNLTFLDGIDVVEQHKKGCNCDKERNMIHGYEKINIPLKKYVLY